MARGYSGIPTERQGVYSIGEHYDEITPLNEWQRVFERIRNIKEVDTTETYTSFDGGVTLASGTAKWWGGSLANNGIIYGVPYNATTILRINPSNDSVSLFGSLAGSRKWAGSAVAPNGKIYCAPRDSTTVLCIDPSNDSITTFGNFVGSDKFVGAIPGYDGNIYLIPLNYNYVVCINPSDNSYKNVWVDLGAGSKYWNGTVDAYGNLVLIGTSAYWSTYFIDNGAFQITYDRAYSGGGVLAPNGKIYGIPKSDYPVMMFNPDTRRAISLGNSNYSGRQGGILAPNGKIYSGLYDSNKMLRIKPSNNTFDDLLLNDLSTGSDYWYGLILAPNGSAYGIPLSATKIYKISGIGTMDDSKKCLLSRYINRF